MAPPPDQRAKRTRPSALVERGGLALVEFHLARQGIDCVRTPRDSSRGDIWADAPIGRISIEVKATGKGSGWFVSRSQHGASELYCFVHLDRARTWVLTSDEIGALLKTAPNAYDHKTARVDLKSFPDGALDAWGKIGGLRMQSVWRSGKPRADKIVKHVLADGSTKEYRYRRGLKGD